MDDIKYFSLFSGIGGFDLGLERASAEVGKDADAPVGQGRDIARDHGIEAGLERGGFADLTSDGSPHQHEGRGDTDRRRDFDSKSRERHELADSGREAGIHGRQIGKPRRDKPDADRREPPQEPRAGTHPYDPTLGRIGAGSEPGRGDSEGRSEPQLEGRGWRIQQELPHFIRVGACEIDKYARQVYEKHFEKVGWHDATQIDPGSLPDFDLLVAGFPCQAFSLAGKRLGFDDIRGTLFFEIVRIARQKRPRLLLLENVFGLLSHDEGRTFGRILSALDEVGYDVEWQVLNSKYFVPQNRERVFLVGHLRGIPFRAIFPLGDSGKEPYKMKLVGPRARGGAEKHYKTMSLGEIAALPIVDLAARDCQLWLWTTNSHLHEAFHILEAWGFKYRVCCTWVKNRFGLGYWLRGQTEHILLATRGNPRTKFRRDGATGMNYSTALIAKWTGHSAKPDASYQMIEMMGEEPRLELFAKKRREGWTQWGDQLEIGAQRRIDFPVEAKS